MAGKLKVKEIGWLIFLIVVSGSCRKAKHPTPTLPYRSLYASGDILCRYGNGYFSRFFREQASRDKLYSHTGIVGKEGDSLFVYHAEANELNGVGSVRKETLNDFLNGIEIYGLYRFNFDDQTKSKIVAKASWYFKQGTPFDARFDLSDDSELYCTELVANCINYATQKATIKAHVRLKNTLFYGIDDIYKNSAVSAIFRSSSSDERLEKRRAERLITNQ